MAEYLRLENLGTIQDQPQPERLREAQKVLPPDRRFAVIRSGLASVFLKKLRNSVNSGHIKAAEHAPQSFDAPSAVTTKPSSPTSHAPAPEAVEQPFIVIDRPVVIRELPDYGKIPTSTLARILLERLNHLEEVEANMFRFTQSLEQKRAAEHAYDRRIDPRPQHQQPTVEPLRICIAGLMSEQQQEVEAKTANVPRPIKLRFFEQTANADLPQRVDYVICSRFVRHAWWDKARAALPSDCVFFVDGGVQSIVQKFMTFALVNP